MKFSTKLLPVTTEGNIALSAIGFLLSDAQNTKENQNAGWDENAKIYSQKEFNVPSFKEYLKSSILQKDSVAIVEDVIESGRGVAVTETIKVTVRFTVSSNGNHQNNIQGIAIFEISKKTGKVQRSWITFMHSNRNDNDNTVHKVHPTPVYPKSTPVYPKSTTVYPKSSSSVYQTPVDPYLKHSFDKTMGSNSEKEMLRDASYHQSHSFFQDGMPILENPESGRTLNSARKEKEVPEDLLKLFKRPLQFDGKPLIPPKQVFGTRDLPSERTRDFVVLDRVSNNVPNNIPNDFIDEPPCACGKK